MVGPSHDLNNSASPSYFQGSPAPVTFCPEDREQRTLDRCEEDPSELNDILKDLPPPVEYSLYSDQLRSMPDGNKDGAWQNSLKLAEKHDKDLCQAYREQIDTLLVFAGLFSAVVTAFVIESYQWLLDDPTETSVELLRDMVVLLSRSSNLTSVSVPPTPATMSETATARINVLWFLSLTLSLSAALVAILCKQWLREFERDVGQSPETALAVRHIRFQGLNYWKVGTVVASVPLMLQSALALFLAGVVDLLWQLHTIVASCVTVVSGVTLLFYLSTTFLPVVQYAHICLKCCANVERSGDYRVLRAFMEPQCAFKSAQAWLALRVFQRAIDYAFNTYASCFTLNYPPEVYPLSLPSAVSWVMFDLNWMKRLEHIHFGSKSAFEGLAWVAAHLDDTYSSTWILHCLWGRWIGNRSPGDSDDLAYIDIACVARAYPEFLDIELEQPAAVRAQAMIFRCSLRTDLPADVSVELILRIAPEIGVGSRWTREALLAAIAIYQGLRIHLSDDVSMGLFHLAELLTSFIIQERVAPDSPDAPDSAYAFYLVVVLLDRGSRLRDQLLPAMSVLALRWLREQPISSYGDVVGEISVYIVAHYGTPGREPLRQRPGVKSGAEFCRRFMELWPDECRTFIRGTHDLQTFSELIAISQERDGGPISASSPPTGPHLSTVTGAGPFQPGSELPTQGRATRNAFTERAAPATDSNSIASVAVSSFAHKG